MWSWVTENRPFTHVFCKELKVGVPFITDDLPAGETTDRNDLRASWIRPISRSLNVYNRPL
jgi:hypothetical protein